MTNKTRSVAVPSVVRRAGGDGDAQPEPASPHVNLNVRSSTVTDLSKLPALISVPRAAAILGLSRASAYRFAAAGHLPARRLGGRLFIVTAQLQAFLDGTETAA
jgi:hypothetical protein